MTAKSSMNRLQPAVFFYKCIVQRSNVTGAIAGQAFGGFR
jgi:hypothetical protein